jgi:nucleoside-diphosphate-sugar epimerase
MKGNRMKKVLVTGHKGFIGNHLCRKLESEGIEVIGLDKDYGGGITNHFLVSRLSQGVDCIFHLGALSDASKCDADCNWAHEVNVTGTFNVLEIARRLGNIKVVFASSAAVYEPMDMYAMTKSIGEAYCRLYGLYKVPITVLRFFNVYGIEQRSEAVIPRFMRRALGSKPFVITGDGEQTRDFVMVDDVAEAIVRASGYEGTFDIGTGKAISINGLVDLMVEVTGVDIPPIHNFMTGSGIKESQAKPPDWFKPRYTLEKGLQKTFDWFKEHKNENTSVDSSL